MLKLEHIKKTFNQNSANEIALFNDLNLTIENGEFVSVIGSNGSGKSTFFNIVSGSIIQDSGNILFNGNDITHVLEHQRSSFVSRVFQDPALGTSPSLTILQNLSIAYNKGKPFNLKKAVDKSLIPFFEKELEDMQLGLESKLNVPLSALSGGQRQALSLLMATFIRPELLLLDEHTAALDPKTSDLIINLTEKIIVEKQITAIMITHNLRHAIKYGNRLLMFHKGKIIMDIKGEEKKQLSVEKLITRFNSLNMLDELDDELAFSTK